MSPSRSDENRRKGYWLGAIAVFLFSLNFVAMKVAVKDFDATFVGLGRGVIAAVPAAAMLYFTRQPWIRREHLLPMALTTAGAVVGFPLFVAIALREVDASHAAVITGLMPLVTAALGSWRDHERQSPLFWAAALAGSGVVLIYAYLHGESGITMADLALLGAVVSASIGYVEGARLARAIGSWQVICWALVLSTPFLIYPVASHASLAYLKASWQAWAGFLYAGFGSMFLGYFIWYRGLALGGTARVSQIQLVQPFLALGSCSLILHEKLALSTILCGFAVFACVLVCKAAKPKHL